MTRPSRRTPEERREAQRQAVVRYRQRHPQRILAYAKHYRATHAEDISIRRKSRDKAYRAAHPEICRASGRRYYATHKEQIYTRSKAWAKAHPEKRRESERRQRQKNTARVKATRKRYNETHKEESRVQNRKWRALHPEQVREFSKRRYARRRGAVLNDLSHAQWIEIQALQNHRCYYCGKRCKGKLTQDHIIPLVKGGDHTASNIVGACGSCNSRKNAGPPLCPVQPLLLTVAPAKKRLLPKTQLSAGLFSV